jgi:hypothetical protein
MCIFCAAIPATAAVGAKLNARQIEARKNAETEGGQPPAEQPIAKVTLGVMGLLLISSVVYHTVVAPALKV